MLSIYTMLSPYEGLDEPPHDECPPESGCTDCYPVVDGEECSECHVEHHPAAITSCEDGDLCHLCLCEKQGLDEVTLEPLILDGAQGSVARPTSSRATRA